MDHPSSSVNHRSIQKNKETNIIGPKPSNSSYLDSTFYRLSKCNIPSRPKKSNDEKTDFFAANFFLHHPIEAHDMRNPSDKLSLIEIELSNEISDEKRFSLLNQRKCLRYLLFGENSIESYMSHLEIAENYNKTEKPNSALRHFEFFSRIDENIRLPVEVIARTAIGRAESYFLMKEKGKKMLSAAHLSLKQVNPEQIPDSLLKLRWYLLCSKITTIKRQFPQLVKCYEAILILMKERNEFQNDVKTANVLEETGNAYKSINNDIMASECFSRAYMIYSSLNMDEDTLRLNEYSNSIDNHQITSNVTINGSNTNQTCRNQTNISIGNHLNHNSEKTNLNSQLSNESKLMEDDSLHHEISSTTQTNKLSNENPPNNYVLL